MWRGVSVYTVKVREQETPDRLAGTDECYVSVPVVYDPPGGHNEEGTLFVTGTKLVFVGESTTAAPWGRIARLSRDGTTLSAFVRDRQSPLVFSCASLFDSVRVAYVAERFLHSAQF